MHCSVSFILFSSSKLNPPYIFIFGLLLFNISKPKNFYETQHRCSIHKWISQIWIQDTVIYVLRENHINWSHSKIFSFCCWVSEGHKIGESPSLIYMKSWFHELATICINISPEHELFIFFIVPSNDSISIWNVLNERELLWFNENIKLLLQTDTYRNRIYSTCLLLMQESPHWFQFW